MKQEEHLHLALSRYSINGKAILNVCMCVYVCVGGMNVCMCVGMHVCECVCV